MQFARTNFCFHVICDGKESEEKMNVQQRSTSSQKPVRKQASKLEAAKAVRRRQDPELATFKSAGSPEYDLPSHRANGLYSSPETETPNAALPTETYADFMGDTPLVELTQLVRSFKNPNVRVFAKVEYFNPSLSIKDRIVMNIFDEAEADGRLKPGMTVVAASSGNTGASCAMVCAMRGYPCIITTSPKCSDEKMNAIRAYGAKLVVSPDGAKEGEPDHYMEIARLLAEKNPEKYFDVDQYDTQSNPAGHFKTLGPELMEQTSGGITHFVAAGSTGGTVSGVGRYLKEHKPEVKVILADPVGSVFTNYFKTGKLGTPGKFLVEGVGKGSIPGAMDMNLIDEVFPVTDEQAFSTCHALARTEGICAGGSAGLNVFAALELAANCEEDAIICTVMPDCGPKNLSKVYNPEWLESNGLKCSPEIALGRPLGVPPVTPEARLRLADEGLLPEDSSSFPTAKASRQLVACDACLYKDLVGSTPLIEITSVCENLGHPETRIYAKVEYFNPSFSMKDRMVAYVLDKAERDGRLRPGMTVVAASSGNTGAACAMMCAMRGYPCIITTSPKCSSEKMQNIKAYGAELRLSPNGVGEDHPQSYMNMAANLARDEPEKYFDFDQYNIKENAEAYYFSLGPEIFEQTKGRVTTFVAGGSTGGTISGTGRFLKEQNGEIRAVLADPIGSIFAGFFRTGSCPEPGKFLVEGVGKQNIPGSFDTSVVDDVISIGDQEAFDMCHKLARTTGACGGGSSGLNVAAAVRLAETSTEPEVIVTVLCDLGAKYLSKIYNPQWLEENGLVAPPTPVVE